jgi:hypothetical protein
LRDDDEDEEEDIDEDDSTNSTTASNTTSTTNTTSKASTNTSTNLRSSVEGALDTTLPNREDMMYLKGSSCGNFCEHGCCVKGGACGTKDECDNTVFMLIIIGAFTAFGFIGYYFKQK